MAQMSSEEALNGIFNILDTMVAQQLKEEAKSPEAKADDTVISLLTGIVEKAKDKAAATVGELLEQLAKGLTAMKEVNHDMIDHVATSIEHVNKALNGLHIDDNTISNVESFVNTIGKIGELNVAGSKKIIEFINGLQLSDTNLVNENVGVIEKTIKVIALIAEGDLHNLQTSLNNIDPNDSKKLVDFINSLSIINSKKVDANISVLQKTIKVISSVIDNDLKKLHTSLSNINPDDSKILIDFINNIQFSDPKSMLKNLSVVTAAVLALNTISQSELYSLRSNLNKLDPEESKKFVDFISNIQFGDTKETIKNISVITHAIKALNDISNAELQNLRSNLSKLNPSDSIKFVDFVSNIQFTDADKVSKDISVVSSAVKAIASLASVDIKNLLNNIKKLDISIASKLGDFITAIIDNIRKANPNDAEIKKLLEPVSKLMNGLSSLFASGIFRMSVSLNPFKGYLLGRQFGQFIKQIIKATKDLDVNANIENIGKLLKNLTTATNLWKASNNINPIKGYIIGKLIAKFIKNILAAVEDAKIPADIDKLGAVLEPLVKLINPNGKLGIYYFKFGKGTALAIATFFNTLVREIPARKDFEETMKGVSIAVDTILKIGIKELVHINIVAKMLSVKAAERVNEFVKTLISGDWDKDKLTQVSEFMRQFSKLLLSMTVSLAIIIAVVAFAPIDAVIAGVAVLYFTIKFMKKAILDIINGIKNGDVKEATALIQSIGKTILVLTGTVAMIALITKFVGIAAVAVGVGVLYFTLRSVKNIIIDLNSKEFKDNLNPAMKALKDISVLLLAMSLSISIVAGTIAGFGLVATGIGFLVVYGFIRMSVYSVKKLAGIDDKNLNTATTALLKVSGAFAIIALVAATLLVPIGKHIGAVIKGGVVVSAIIALGIFAVNLMQDMKNLDEATNALLKLAGVFAIIALVTDFILIPIGKKLKHAIFGALVVTTIVGLLIGGVKLITNMKDTDTKNAIKTLAAITLLFVGISLLVKFILIPIGKHADDAFFGGAVVLGIEFILIKLVKMLQKTDAKELTNAVKVLAAITLIFGAISLITKFLLIPIGLNFSDALLGGVATIAILGILMYGVKIVSKLKPEEFKNALITLASITLIYGLVSLIAKELLIPIGLNFGDALLGGVATLAILGVLLIGVKLISSIKVEKFKNALITLTVLTFVYLGIALITKEILIPIGDKFVDAMAGAGVTLLILGALILGVYILNKVDGKDVLYAVAAVAGLAFIYLGIALMTKGILIPIGEHSKEAALGAGVTLLIIGALMVGVYLLNKIKGKDALYAILATAAIAIILLGVSLITKEILIPIGEQWDKALIGAGVVIGIITVFGLIMFAVGELTKNESVQEALIRGGITLMGIAAVLLVIGLCMSVFTPIAQQVGNNWEDILLGSGVIVLILAAFGAIMGGVGLLAKNPSVQEALVAGGLTLMGISAVLLIVGLCMSGFIPIAMQAGSNWEDVLLGSGIIVLLLAAIGAVMVGIGLLLMGPQAAIIAAAIAVGGAFLLGIAGITLILGGLMNTFFGVVSKVMKYDEKAIKKAGESMKLAFSTIYDVIDSLVPGGLFGAIKLVKKLAVIAAGTLVALAMIPFMLAIGSAAATIKKIVGMVTVDTIHAFSLIVIGAGENDPNSIIGSLNKIVKGFSNFDGVFKAMIISYAIRPIIDTIEQFVDVIMKVATMNYIEGYDENGKPRYKKLPADVFSSAAHAVTTSFMEFVLTLSDGFEKIDAFALIAMSFLTKALKPIITLVGKFVDVVMKVATGTYVMGYDENGNPEFEHLKAEDFSAAGYAVADTFSHFILSLGDAFDKIGWKSILAMKIMGNTMKPIMQSVKDFVDTVIKVATMTVVTGYDENGHPEFEQVDVGTFLTAGVVVAETFGLFVQNLGDAFKNMDWRVAYAMDAIKDSIAPLMEGVSSFVDSILKLSTGQYVDHYDVIRDKDGNPVLVPRFKRVTEGQYITAALTISTMFALFIDKITDVFTKHGSFWGNKTEDALEAIGDSIAPVMEGVGQFVEAIMQLATGTYVDHMEKDKDGKWVPIYKHLKPSLFILAAASIQVMFISFIDALIKNMSKGDFIKKAEDAKDAILDSINPIMQAVKDFSEALKPFLAMTTNDKDKTAKASDYICLQPGKIKQISTGIANAFVEFIRIIATHLSNPKNQEMYESIRGTAKDVLDVLNIIKKATSNLASIIKSMTNDEGKVLEQGKDVATLFTTVLTMFATYFQSSGDMFAASIDSAKSCKLMIDEIKDVSKVFVNIINSIKGLNDDKVKVETLVDTFNNSLLKITTTIETISKRSEVINFMMIRELTDTYMRIALMLALTSDFMNEHADLTSGIDTFITNIKKLTAPDFNKQMMNTSGSIKLYTTRIKEFTALIEVTTAKVEIYTTKLDDARKALEALDKQIINNEQKRNQALDNFANRIDNIANAINRMERAFNNLDENKILNKFENIRELLETVNTNVGGTTTQTNVQRQNTQNNTQVNQRQNVQQNRTQNGRTTQNTVQHTMFPTTGMVTFEFKDTTLRGFFKTN